MEVHKSLLHDHIKSKGHKEIEDYFIVKCMTYCHRCRRERTNDEGRQHRVSDRHLRQYGEKHCDICKLKYTIIRNGVYLDASERNHLESDFHKKDEERLGFHTN